MSAAQTRRAIRALRWMPNAVDIVVPHDRIFPDHYRALQALDESKIDEAVFFEWVCQRLPVKKWPPSDSEAMALIEEYKCDRLRMSLGWFRRLIYRAALWLLARYVLRNRCSVITISLVEFK